MSPDEQKTAKQKLNLSIDLRIVIIALLIIVIGMLAWCRPWAKTAVANSRTIQVTGEASVKSDPDEFVFYPNYEFKNASKDIALAELSKKSDAIVTELKKLGVSDAQIKTNAADYQRGLYFPEQTGIDTTYTLNLTVTVANKELAQKVQDYLVTTSPTGSISPQPSFSQAKQKLLQSQARAEAEKDARIKAEQSAKNLGFKLGNVKSVSESNTPIGIMPMAGTATIAEDSGKTTVGSGSISTIRVQPGQNEINYSVSVTYYIK